MNISGAVLEELSRGLTVPQIAKKLKVSVPFVQVVLDHYERAGLAQSAASLCSSGLGACTPGPLSVEARVACAGCPLKI